MTATAQHQVGDEVCCLVIDLGTEYLRVGYSGDDHPQVVLPSIVGVIDNKSAGSASPQHLFGDLSIYSPRPDMELKCPLTATEAVDWHLVELLLNFAVCKKLGATWTDHPVLFVDNPFWTRETREKLVHLLFDRFDVPAVYLGRAPVLAAFASGKHTALVVDLGASAVRVAPVLDGYLVKTGLVQESKIGGNAISEQLEVFLRSPEVGLQELRIPQLVERKRPVELGQAADCDVRSLKGITASYSLHHRLRLVLDDLKHSIVQISETSFNERDLAIRPPKYYELPDGFNRNFGLERFRIGEQVFQPAQFRYEPIKEPEANPGTSSAQHPLGLAELINKSLQLCDPEYRSSLAANVIITGGGSSYHGLFERVNFELSRIPAFGRYRLQIGATLQERKYGPWIGGSILASLGTFQQLWLTKAEYREHGSAYIDRKCP